MSPYNFSSSGMTKARVFPDPVLAAPNTSLPESENGSDSLCTVVGTRKPESLRPRRVTEDRGTLEKSVREAGDTYRGR